MNSFQNFGDVNDNQIRARMRELLMNRAIDSEHEKQVFDENLNKELMNDIDLDEQRNTFESNQTMGTGMYYCKCGDGYCDEGGKKKMVKKMTKKRKTEAMQELKNIENIRKNLKPQGKKITKGVSEYNDNPNIDVEKTLEKRLKKMAEKKKFKQAERKYERELYGLDEKSEDENEGQGANLKSWIDRCKDYAKRNNVTYKQAMIALKKK